MGQVLQFKLVEPSAPAHLTELDGQWYARLETRAEPPPDRFGRALASDEAAGPPWSTLVAGLESGKHGMRGRFEAAIVAGIDREFLMRAISACYAGVYGIRGEGPKRDEFEAWVDTLPEDLGAARSPRELGDTQDGGALQRLGCQRIVRDWETGHIPADHDAYLYDLSDWVAALDGTFFEQACLIDTDDPEAWEQGQGEKVAYTLRAWVGGKRYAGAAVNQGDYADGDSVLGFLNAVLRVLGDEHRFVYGDEDHESVVVAERNVIARARAEGLLQTDDEFEA